MEELSNELAIDKFVNYCNNYKMAIIQGKHNPTVFKAFDYNPAVQLLMITMWLKESSNYDGSFGMFKMFYQMDLVHRRLFVKWILTNHKM